MHSPFHAIMVLDWEDGEGDTAQIMFIMNVRTMEILRTSKIDNQFGKISKE